MSNEINIEELERLAKELINSAPWTSQHRDLSIVFAVTMSPDGVLSLIDRLKKAEAELERERMRLAACGVVAMADTPESAAKAREMRDEYRSASCDDVARRVDECMTLRAERDALAAKLAIAQGMADTMAMLRSEMIDAGVIDASVAPMFFPESIIPRLLRLAELEGQTDNLLSTCHRLALELECLLLDTKDLAPVSRWWDSAMVALDEWHKAKDSVSARQIPAEPVNVDFGKRGENMFFKIGSQSFLLDYKPE